MSDQSSAELGGLHLKRNLWEKIRRLGKKETDKQKVIPSVILPDLSKPPPYASHNRWGNQIFEQASRGDYSDVFHPAHFGDHSRILYAADSQLPDQCNNSYELSRFLKEKGLLPDVNDATILPDDSSRIETFLPTYLKLSTIDIDQAHRIHIISPSSEFLELTEEYRDGQFLFRGEEAKSLDKAADLIAKRFEDGSMKHHQGEAITTSPEPLVSLRRFGGAVSGNYPLVWIIKREAMDDHPVDIQNGGWEILFPEISLKYLAGCVTSPEVAKAVEEKTKIPPGFLRTLPFRTGVPAISADDTDSYLKQLDEGLMNHIKELEK